jgi:hypothetical protein
MSVENDVKGYLDSRSLGSTVFMGPVRPADPPAIPRRVVFVLETGGIRPEAFMDGANTTYRRFGVQIRVRGEPNDYQTTRDLAKSVWTNMNLATTSGHTGSYIEIRCDQSNPLYMGRDAYQCDEYSINVTLAKRIS